MKKELDVLKDASGNVQAINEYDLAQLLDVRHQSLVAQVKRYRFQFQPFAFKEADDHYFTAEGCENIALSFDNRQIWKNWEKKVKPLFPDPETVDIP